MSTIIPSTLLQNYRDEYETTTINIPQLCTKYNIDKATLGNTSSWNKIDTIKNRQPEQVAIPCKIDTLNLDKPRLKPSADIDKDIKEFKELAMAHALAFMKNDAEFSEVKEFKDMVAIVGTIEASFKDNKPDNVINIAIQNILGGFKDDC